MHKNALFFENYAPDPRNVTNTYFKKKTFVNLHNFGSNKMSILISKILV